MGKTTKFPFPGLPVYVFHCVCIDFRAYDSKGIVDNIPDGTYAGLNQWVLKRFDPFFVL